MCVDVIARGFAWVLITLEMIILQCYMSSFRGKSSLSVIAIQDYFLVRHCIWNLDCLCTDRGYLVELFKQSHQWNHLLQGLWHSYDIHLGDTLWISDWSLLHQPMGPAYWDMHLVQNMVCSGLSVSAIVQSRSKSTSRKQYKPSCGLAM